VCPTYVVTEQVRPEAAAGRSIL